MLKGQYNCYNTAKVGDRVMREYGEPAWLVYKATGIITPVGDYTDEEYEELTQDTITYIFKSDDGVYNTCFYCGDIILYDFPSINEYHHKKMLEIDPNDYDIGGYYETTYEYAKGE